MRRTWTTLALTLALLLALTTLTGCGMEPTQPPPDGTWRLRTLVGDAGPQPADPLVPSTLVLSAGAVSGNGGVNNLHGTYRRTASGEIEFADLAVTEMAGTPAALRQETRFVAGLRAARHYEVVDGTLVLRAADQTVLMVLGP